MHLNISICEDNKSDLHFLETCIHTICNELNLTPRIASFASAEEFLAVREELPPPDIIFMDIYMDGINGMEAARRISGTVRSRFVFTTTTREYAPEAFALNAAHYLLKPLTADSVREAIRRCLPESAKKTDTRLLEIKTRQGNVPVPMEKIAYIEVFNKICVIHTEEACIQTYASLDALSRLLDDGLFIRAQRSYIVNMKFIESFFFDHIILRNGKEIVLSRNNRAELKKRYQQFLFHLARRDVV